MKKIYIFLFISILFSSLAKAQGVYQMWGMTEFGGTDNAGSMFSVNSFGNNFQKRYDFNITNPGKNPYYEALAEYNGKFYGLTGGAGFYNLGVIFEWNPTTNIYTKKVDLNTTTGSNPSGGLTFYAGKFYGMTKYGGVNNLGVIFEWDPATNIYTKKIDLNGTIGGNPEGSLTLEGGKFYGLTTSGGAGAGVIFEWNPATNIYTKKIDFNGTNGGQPHGNNLTFNAGKFYGVTTYGGTSSYGVIFEWDPTTNIYTKKIDFDGVNGRYPTGGSMTFSNGKFYGTTLYGGSINRGVIYEWDPATNIYIQKIDLANTVANSPYGSLTLVNNVFYGTTYYGGNFGLGTIFKWDPFTNVFQKKADFNGADNGQIPVGTLTLSGGKLYGTTPGGGAGEAAYGKTGVIFEFDPLTDILTKKIDFNAPTLNGTIPKGSLTVAGGKFYGMTSKGGLNNSGVIFEWNPTTATYSKIFDFSSVNGSNPAGSLTENNGKLYGMTSAGGANGVGVIFEWDPLTNAYTKKIDLITVNGSNPLGNLTYNAGKFYGMTFSGGINNKGVIFDWNPVTNVYTKKIDFGQSNENFMEPLLMDVELQVVVVMEVHFLIGIPLLMC
jgi:uncharacterized repeat protein (TIGR03803 family)